ncbi:MAG: TIGR02453 family protein [Bacteroidota bacterium]
MLGGLKDNNDRDWFNARKSVYTRDLKEPLDLLVRSVLVELALRDSPFTSGRAMRIYRDVRFSADKSPYRTNIAASFSRDRDGDPVFLYVQIEPGASFVASGVYRAKAKTLLPIRQRVVSDPGGWRAMTDALEGAGLAFGSMGHVLRSMPRGFASAKDAEFADAVRWESYIAQRNLSDSLVMSPDLAKSIAVAATDAAPLVRFIDEARGA